MEIGQLQKGVAEHKKRVAIEKVAKAQLQMDQACYALVNAGISEELAVGLMRAKAAAAAKGGAAKAAAAEA
jgi:hypothetical protein